MQAAKFVLQLIKTSCKEGVTSSRRFGDVYKSICYVEASLITFLFLSSLGDPALPCPMSPFHECCLPVGLACPEPFAVTRSDTCVIKYPDTVVDIVEPDFPPYSVIYPGPTLTTFPQQTLVGSTALLDIRSFLGSQGFHGFGGQPKPCLDICG